MKFKCIAVASAGEIKSASFHLIENGQTNPAVNLTIGDDGKFPRFDLDKEYTLQLTEAA